MKLDCGNALAARSLAYLAGVSAAVPAGERRAALFPLRKDLAPPVGFKTIDQYNASPADFLAVMRDRARV